MVNSMRTLPLEEAKRELENHMYDCYEDEIMFNTFVKTVSGHNDIHYNLSDSDAIAPLIGEERKTSSSYFENKEDAIDLICNAICFNSEEIIKWVQDTRCGYQSAKDYYEYAFSVDMKEDVGRGFDSSLKEKVTPVVRVVLERDEDAPFSFYCKTAYPDIVDEKSKFTGFKYSAENIIDGKLNIKDPLRRLNACIKTLPNTSSHITPQGDIRVSFTNAKIIAYIDQNSICAKVKTPDASYKIDTEELKDKAPRTYKKLCQIKEFKDRIYNNEKKSFDNVVKKTKERQTKSTASCKSAKVRQDNFTHIP